MKFLMLFAMQLVISGVCLGQQKFKTRLTKANNYVKTGIQVEKGDVVLAAVGGKLVYGSRNRSVPTTPDGKPHASWTSLMLRDFGERKGACVFRIENGRMSQSEAPELKDGKYNMILHAEHAGELHVFINDGSLNDLKSGGYAIVVSVRKPACFEEGADIVPQIPHIMSRVGFAKGKELIDIWLQRPAATDIESAQPVTNVITLQWMFQFDGVEKEFKRARKKDYWWNYAARIAFRNQLREMIRNGDLQLPKRNGERVRFNPWLDRYARPPSKVLKPSDAKKIHSYQHQYRNYGLWDHLRNNWNRFFALNMIQDLQAALNVFNYYLVLGGEIERQGSQFIINLDQLGTYMMDDYAFEGNEWLGCWSLNAPYVRYKCIGMDGTGISDQAFQNWRKCSAKGGDFRVFSDIFVEQINHDFPVEGNYFNP